MVQNLSAQAQAVLADPPPYEPYQLEPALIEAWRTRIDADAAGHAQAEVARLGVQLRDCSVGGTQCLEVLPPQAPTRTILYCFGGGYVSGSPEADLGISAALSAACNARVIAPYYRLAPEHPYPAAVEDARAVALTMEGDWTLVGESAGGNLALVTAMGLREAGSVLPRAMALLSPWCDLTHSGDSLSANDGRDPMLRTDDVARAAAAYAAGRDLADPGISPLFGDMAGLPPAILTTGTRDLLLSPTVQLADAMRRAGGTVDLRVWEQMWHVFEFYDLPEARHSLAEIAAFLMQHDGL